LEKGARKARKAGKGGDPTKRHDAYYWALNKRSGKKPFYWDHFQKRWVARGATLLRKPTQPKLTANVIRKAYVADQKAKGLKVRPWRPRGLRPPGHAPGRFAGAQAEEGRPLVD